MALECKLCFSIREIGKCVPESVYQSSDFYKSNDRMVVSDVDLKREYGIVRPLIFLYFSQRVFRIELAIQIMLA